MDFCREFYSDLHLEFGKNFNLPEVCDADILILAGDIITFTDYSPLLKLLKNWKKSVLYVAGNHKYYTREPISQENQKFKAWAKETIPQLIFLQNEFLTINGINFFGGTMWTDFEQANQSAMLKAQNSMNDFRLIRTCDKQTILTPQDTIGFHETFKQKLIDWLEMPLIGERVVITHHAPTVNPKTQYADSPISPAFNSLDMLKIIEDYQPNLWVYGHTHECDDQTIGKTRILSNQLGYPNGLGGYECAGFDKKGKEIEIIK